MATKFPLVNDIDFSTLSHSDPKKSQGGAGVAFCYSRRSKNDRSDVDFQLLRPNPGLLLDETPKKQRMELLDQLPYVRSGFHLQSQPTFGDSNGKHTFLIAIPDDLATCMKGLDEANVSEVISNAQAWFKRGNLPPDLVRAQYNTLVKWYPETAETPDSEKVHVIRTKIVEGKTEVLVQSGENYKKFHHGDFRDLTNNARIIPILSDRGIYFRSTESGGQLHVKRILVMHGGSFSTANAKVDTGDIEIEIEEDFVPPQSVPVKAPFAGAAMDCEDPASVTEQTVVNAGAWNAAADPSAVF
jgi:hypothetical protein